MIRFAVSFVFCLGAAAGGVAVAGGSGEQGGWGGGRDDAACIVYEHADYGGERWALGRNEAQNFVGQRWNDRISSVECRPGCALTAYEHAEYRGGETRFDGRVRFVGPAWNDRISALRVDCRSGWGGREPACTFYEHANFQGRSEAVRDGAAVASIGAAWNDRISSVSCRPGCAFIGYEHVGWSGGQNRWTGETRFVGPQWNDRISGYRVQCG